MSRAVVGSRLRTTMATIDATDRVEDLQHQDCPWIGQHAKEEPLAAQDHGRANQEMSIELAIAGMPSARRFSKLIARDVPDRNRKVGAQRWVTQRVKN